MNKRVLIIDDKKQTRIIENLVYDAKKKGVVLDCDEYNVGDPNETELLSDDGHIIPDKVIEVYKDRFDGRHYDLIACDWNLNDETIDGVSLLKRMGNQCFDPDTPKIMYSGLLEPKLKEKIKHSKDGELKDDQFVGFIKHMVTGHYLKFLDRGDLSKEILNFLLNESKSLDSIIFHYLKQNPNRAFSMGFGHSFDKMSFAEVYAQIKGDKQLKEEFKSNLVAQVLGYLSEMTV